MTFIIYTSCDSVYVNSWLGRGQEEGKILLGGRGKVFIPGTMGKNAMTAVLNLHIKDVIHDWSGSGTERICVSQESPSYKGANKTITGPVLEKGPGNDAPTELGRGLAAAPHQLFLNRWLEVKRLGASSTDAAGFL